MHATVLLAAHGQVSFFARTARAHRPIPAIALAATANLSTRAISSAWPMFRSAHTLNQATTKDGRHDDPDGAIGPERNQKGREAKGREA